jgi:uncharacterized repeat protein (TIGR03803 family)
MPRPFVRHAIGAALTVVLLTGCASYAIPAANAPGASVVPARPQPGPAEKIVYRFQGRRDGAGGYADLLCVGSTLYGTTSRGGLFHRGSVFALTIGGKNRTIYSFRRRNDGLLPQAGLINVAGDLYGTTSDGGAYASGTVFAVTPSGKERIVYSFKGGTTGDGSGPWGPLLALKRTLYGTTASGGATDNGTVFAVTTSGDERIVYSFKGGHDGQRPYSGLIFANGLLYGTTNGTSQGGGGLLGTVFSVTTAGSERVLYRFGGAPDGANPYAGLVNLRGTLYGTTVGGGTSNFGTVFAITPSGKERTIHNFKGGRDGEAPSAPLISRNGILYGTTQLGGGEQQRCDGCGTVFELSATHSEKVIYSFKFNPDGASPVAGLTAVDGALYGVTEEGGYGLGTVFRLSPPLSRAYPSRH